MALALTKHRVEIIKYLMLGFYLGYFERKLQCVSLAKGDRKHHYM